MAGHATDGTIDEKMKKNHSNRYLSRIDSQALSNCTNSPTIIRRCHERALVVAHAFQAYVMCCVTWPVFRRSPVHDIEVRFKNVEEMEHVVGTVFDGHLKTIDRAVAEGGWYDTMASRKEATSSVMLETVTTFFEDPSRVTYEISDPYRERCADIVNLRTRTEGTPEYPVINMFEFAAQKHEGLFQRLLYSAAEKKAIAQKREEEARRLARYGVSDGPVSVSVTLPSAFVDKVADIASYMAMLVDYGEYAAKRFDKEEDAVAMISAKKSEDVKRQEQERASTSRPQIAAELEETSQKVPQETSRATSQATSQATPREPLREPFRNASPVKDNTERCQKAPRKMIARLPGAPYSRYKNAIAIRW